MSIINLRDPEKFIRTIQELMYSTTSDEYIIQYYDDKVVIKLPKTDPNNALRIQKTILEMLKVRERLGLYDNLENIEGFELLIGQGRGDTK